MSDNWNGRKSIFNNRGLAKASDTKLAIEWIPLIFNYSQQPTLKTTIHMTCNFMTFHSNLASTAPNLVITYHFLSSGQRLISMGVVDHFHHVLMGWISVWAWFVTFISLSLDIKVFFSLRGLVSSYSFLKWSPWIRNVNRGGPVGGFVDRDITFEGSIVWPPLLRFF